MGSDAVQFWWSIAPSYDPQQDMGNLSSSMGYQSSNFSAPQQCNFFLFNKKINKSIIKKVVSLFDFQNNYIIVLNNNQIQFNFHKKAYLISILNEFYLVGY